MTSLPVVHRDMGSSADDNKKDGAMQLKASPLPAEDSLRRQAALPPSFTNAKSKEKTLPCLLGEATQAIDSIHCPVVAASGH